ncbi:MAG TPA: DNA methyltransferase [Candidatus Nitrosotalea sp.]|nr:DNA methyltransferase [Candidatus Nitrosotalea sp.]
MLQNFFVLSGEQIELAKDEIISISKSYDSNTEHESESRLVITKSNASFEKIVKRAAFVKVAGNISGIFHDVNKIELEIPRPDAFACRTINLSSKKVDGVALEREAGAILKKKWSSKVSLSNPSLTVYLILTDTKRYIGYSDMPVEPKRPEKIFKYPHELEWKLARCMVNLSSLREGQTLCDPFCGTGTILLEAESMGIHSVGIDFDEKMCNISEKNLVQNGYESRIINSSFDYIQKIKDDIDAVVTDVPYGTASRSSASPKKLIQDFISILPKKKRLVMVYKKGMDIDELGKAKKYEVYRHKSLTRVIAVR